MAAHPSLLIPHDRGQLGSAKERRSEREHTRPGVLKKDWRWVSGSVKRTFLSSFVANQRDHFLSS